MYNRSTTIKNYLELVRLKHGVKNLLIFLPLIYSGNLFFQDKLIQSIIAFVAFTFAASAIYVINDIRDRDLDRKHPRKKNRPVASGKISVQNAWIYATSLILLSVTVQIISGIPLQALFIVATYLVINLLYSFGLKNVPIIDIGIISLGFILRVFYGGEAIGVEVSQWLGMVVLVFSLYLALGKREGEIKSGSAHTRKVNQHYTKEFLDKNMFVCLTLSVVFYSLWTVENSAGHPYLFWTIPLVIAIMMLYSFDVEKSGVEADPATVLFSDKVLMSLVVIYMLSIIGIMYI